MEEKKREKESMNAEKINDLTAKIRKNPWIVSTVVLAIVALIFLVLVVRGGSAGLSEDDAGNKLTDYLNSLVGGGVTYVSSEDLGSLYQVTVNYQDQDIPVFVSKDGKYFIQAAVPIETSDDSGINVNDDPQPQDIPKTDKPQVDLFVMTHCPYGTQAEKGFLPIVKLLGSKVNANIRFVHYFMHGDQEEIETYNQVCIREEQNTKFIPYLECFLEDANSSRCISKIGIDQTKLNTCLANNNAKAKEYYAADAELSQEYGVQGSPTLVINGVQASSGRSQSAFLSTICSAFNTQAGECSNQVSSDNPSAGFGYGTAAASTTAQC